MRNRFFVIWLSCLVLTAGVLCSARSFASQVTNSPYGSFTFEGNTCAAMLRGVARAFSISNPGSPSAPPWYDCSSDTFLNPGVVSIFWRVPGTTSGVFDVTLVAVDPPSAAGGGGAGGSVSLDLGGLTQWVNLSAEDGAYLAGALLSMWVAGYAIRSIIDVIRGSST